MPKDTFFNLDDEKRQRIIEAAIDEFSENSYEVSSINQIVKNASIAKGSFYQYFENKDDLYRYVIDICGEKKREYISRVLNRAEYMNFYDKLSEVYRAMMTFSDDNPKIASTINHLYRIDDVEFRNEMAESTDANTFNIFRELVDLGQQEGKVKKSLNPDFLSSLLYNTAMFLIEYREGQGVLYDIESAVNDIMNIISSGIKPSPRNKGLMNLL